MKALCADVDKVGTRSQWPPLQRGRQHWGGGSPPQLPVAAGLLSASLHGVKPPQKITVGVLCSKGGRRNCLGDKGKLRINSRSVSLGGSLLKVPLRDFGSQQLCVEVWKIFREDCFLFAMQLQWVLA